MTDEQIRAAINNEAQKAGLTVDIEEKSHWDNISTAVKQLIAESTIPSRGLQIVQAAAASPSSPDGGRRAGAKYVFSVLVEELPRLSKGDKIGWVKLAATIVTRAHPPEPARYLLEPPIPAMSDSAMTAEREIDVLWWSQALYSRSRSADYRDLADEAPSELLHAMAADLIGTLGPIPEPAARALFVETALRILPQLDEKRPWDDWRHWLLSRGVDTSSAFWSAVKEDHTLLPLSGWLVGHSDQNRTIVSGRHVARQYIRERMLAAWFDQASG